MPSSHENRKSQILTSAFAFELDPILFVVKTPETKIFHLSNPECGYMVFYSSFDGLLANFAKSNINLFDLRLSEIQK